MRKYSAMALVVVSLLAVASCSLLFTDVQVTVTNSTSQTIDSLKTKRVEDIDWGAELLESPILPVQKMELYITKSIIAVSIHFSSGNSTTIDRIDLTKKEIFNINITEEK